MDGNASGQTAPATARDRRLFGPGRKRILALKGGGVRGAISIATLERIETLLSERAGRPVLLGEYFNLIGGTSTGSIIASGLALGFTASYMRDLYLELGPRAFKRSGWRILGLQAKFDSRLLRREIEGIIGDRTLDSPDLLTGLAIVTKRLDTGSPWVLTNNPRTPYWDDPADGSYIGNRRFPLANIVRASTAAPYYFDPELLPIADGAPPGLFLDGGVTPFNNPALQLLLIATLDVFGLSWATGAEDLLLVSIGTGHSRTSLTYEGSRRLPSTALAVMALGGLIADAENHMLTVLHWLSGSAARWPINGEIGTLAGVRAPGDRPVMTFRHFDVQLEATWLAEVLDIRIPPRELAMLRRLDDPLSLKLGYEVGKAAAEKLIGPEDLPPVFDLPPGDATTPA